MTRAAPTPGKTFRVRKPSRPPDELRLAAIDVGSNSIHMVVAQVDAAGGITILWRGREMVGLGRMSFPSHRLSKHAIERALLTLRRFVSEAQRWQCEQLVAVATSAVREAENGGEFIDLVRSELGVHVRVVSARDEARLIYLGVRHALALDRGPHLIVDLGGGSVEFIVADNDRPLLLESRKLGAARMTSRFIKSDPVDGRDLKALLAHYEKELSPLIPEVQRLHPVRVIGTSGAIENLAALCGDAADSDTSPSTLTRPDLKRVLDILVESQTEDRAKMKGLDDKRRDQILAAALLVHEMFHRLGVEELEVCSSALREGIIVDYLSRHRPELEIRSEVANSRRRAVLDLGRRCHWNRQHAEQVARLAGLLFDHTKRLHRLTRRDRELIEYGALLHDIGAMIGREKHHKHSFYLVVNGKLEGFTKTEVRTIAHIARYHRKAMPTRKHSDYDRLSKRSRGLVKTGAALLRIADGLDRTNCSVIEDLVCRIRRELIEVLVTSRGDAELEIWSAQSRGKLLERVFKRKLSVRGVG